MKSASFRYAIGTLALMAFMTLAAPALAAPPVENTQCILGQPGAPNGLNCTSNDISLSSPIVTVVDGCSYPGDTALLQVLVDVTNNAQNRYDVGVWISVDGDPNGDGAETGICTAVSIPPDIFNADGVSVDADGDQCGDVENASTDPDILQADLGTFTLQCIDSDGDGNINVPLIIAWNNQTGGANCTDSTFTTPNTPAKCRANPDSNLPVPVPARLIVNKTTTGGDPTSFEFTLAGPTPSEVAPGGWDGSDEVFNLAHGEQFDSAVAFANGGLPAGDNYSVTETPTPGWISMGTCSSDVDGANTNPADLDLRAGETVTCNFTNTPDTGTLTIVKQTQGLNTASFDFNGSGSIGAFSLDTGGGNPAQQQFVVSPGTFTVTETVTAGWTLTSASCTSAGEVVNLGTGAVSNIVVAAGANVTCTFVNTELGTITLTKIAIGGDDTFGFVSDIEAEGADDFDITTVGGTGTVGGGFQITPGSYTATEDTLPAGWEFVSAACQNQEGDITDSVDPVTRSISFTAGEGDTISCTVTNQALGTIIVEKVTDPSGAPDSFNFAGDAAGSIAHGGNITVANLSPGTYTSTETVPAGWDLSSIVCDDENSTGDTGSATATFNVEAGETVTCVFTNTQRGSVTIEKVIQGEVGELATAFDFTTDLGAGFQLDPVNASASEVFDNVEPGTYTVTEAAAAGWVRFSASCTSAGEVVNLATGEISNIVVGPGEDVTCTYTNEPDEVIFDILTEVCINDTPFVDYDVTTTGGNPVNVTITWIKNDGSDEVVETLLDQPLVGQLLWPGAAVDMEGNPIDWPGWDFVDGQWIQIDDGLRPTMILRFEINPTAEIVVSYPPATPACDANPPPPPPPPAPFIPVPVDNPWALLLMVLSLMGLAWYFRPALQRRMR